MGTGSSARTVVGRPINIRAAAVLSRWRNGLYDRIARAFYHFFAGEHPVPVFRFTWRTVIIRLPMMWRDV